MKILAIDTTAAAASAAVCEDGFLMGEYFVNLKQTHSQTIMPMIDNLLRLCRVDLKDIGLFAVSTGPGSFTGVRIGVAAIKGLALPFGTPCADVSALEALAYNAAGSQCEICACMDARRNQFYNALFESNGENIKRLTEDRAISFENLSNDINLAVSSEKNIVLVGDGAKLCYNNLKEKNFDMQKIKLAPQNIRFARASSVAAIGYKLYSEGKTVSSESLLPSYLRLPQAQRELKKRKNDKTGV